jgi:prepilin-type N-terminal cleavage/methylation domain-containing protein
MRRAFSLIELLVSIVILSLMMLFLYKSYANLNRSNIFYGEEVAKITKVQKIKKIFFLDITQAQSITILNQERDEDVVFLQTKNSLHHRIEPYVAYIVKEKKLYRLESLREFKEYPLVAESDFVVDELGDVALFRLYASQDTQKHLYLLHALFEDKEEILLKLKALNTK